MAEIKKLYKGQDVMDVSATDKHAIDHWTNQGWTGGHIGATNWEQLQKQYTPHQLEQSTQRIGQDIFWNPSVNITDIPKTPTQLGIDEMAEDSPNIPMPDNVPTPDSLVEGLAPTVDGIKSVIESMQAPLASQDKKDETLKEIEDTYSEFDRIPEVHQEKLDELGTPETIKQLQELMPQMATLKAEYDRMAVAQEGRVASASSIYGRQAMLQRQSAVELAGLSAMAQALQGNINMAYDIAQRAVEVEFEPFRMRIESQKLQLDAIYKDLNREDKIRADQLNLILNERERAMNEARETKENINNLALVALQGGADIGTVQRMMGAETYEEALQTGFNFLKPQEPGGIINLGNGQYFDTTNNTMINESDLGKSVIIPETSRIASVHNNPGNLMFANQPGATKGEPKKGGGYWAFFNSPEEGYEALKRQVELDASRGLTLEQFINKYAPPTENDSRLYLSQAMKELNVGSQVKISDIDTDALARFIAKKESGTIIRTPSPTTGTSDFDVAYNAVISNIDQFKTEDDIKFELQRLVSDGKLDLSVTQINTISKQAAQQFPQIGDEAKAWDKAVEKELNNLIDNKNSFSEAFDKIRRMYPKEVYPGVTDQIIRDALRGWQFDPEGEPKKQTTGTPTLPPIGTQINWGSTEARNLWNETKKYLGIQ